MALPLSRNTIYAPGSQVKSADLNDVQDWIARGFAGTHGERTLLLGPASAFLEPTFAFGPGYLVGAGSAYFEPPLLVGDRIKSVRVYGRDSVGTPISARLYEISMTTGAQTPRSAAAFSNLSGNSQSLALSGLTPFSVQPGRRPSLFVGTSSATHRIYGVQLTYDHP